MITCTCVDCEKSVKFKDMQEAKSFRWHLLGIDMKENSYYAICPACDTTISNVTISTKPKEEIKKDLINSKSISYD